MATKPGYAISDGNNTRHRLWLRSIKFLNAVLVTIPFALCWYLYYAERLYNPYYAKGDMLVVALFLVLYIGFGRIYSAFTISLYRISEIVYSQSLALIFTNAIAYVVTWLLTRHLPNPIPLLLAMALEILLSAIWAAVAHTIYFKLCEPINTVIIWDMRKGLEELIESCGLDIRFNITSTPNVWEAFKDPDKYMEGTGAVFMC